MANILLIEDDERQIRWAKESCSEHNLTIFTTRFEWANSKIYSELEDNSQTKDSTLFLTDLYLPYKKGDIPSPGGLYLFVESLKWLILKQMSGVAILSNFDHHIYEDRLEQFERGQLNGIDMIVDNLGKHIEAKWQDKFRWMDLSIESSVPNPLNMLIMYDSVIVEGYTHFMSPEGKILNRKEIEDKFGHGKYSEHPAKLAMKAGYLNLKPFKFVVDVLMSG